MVGGWQVELNLPSPQCLGLFEQQVQRERRLLEQSAQPLVEAAGPQVCRGAGGGAGGAVHTSGCLEASFSAPQASPHGCGPPCRG